jgi:mannitol-specific phosphotransferase system IIBC component|tara:strand:+ start:985 stop:1383 length:399 start_codon:yes stop_codon:yes gene_type:complete
MGKILAKLFGGAGADIAGKISGIIDKHTFSKEERAQLKQEMDKVFIEAEADMQKNVTERWKADLQHGNWLTKSVRPLVLIFLVVSTVVMVFIDSGFIAFDVEEKWTDLLQLTLITVIGAYFGGRSIEKVKKQ